MRSLRRPENICFTYTAESFPKEEEHLEKVSFSSSGLVSRAELLFFVFSWTETGVSKHQQRHLLPCDLTSPQKSNQAFGNSLGENLLGLQGSNIPADKTTPASPPRSPVQLSSWPQAANCCHINQACDRIHLLAHVSWKPLFEWVQPAQSGASD